MLPEGHHLSEIRSGRSGSVGRDAVATLGRLRRSGHYTLRWTVLAAVGCVLAACSGEQAERPKSEPEVIGSDGVGSNLQRFDVREQGRLMIVQVFNRGGSARTVSVSARSPRALDRADGQLALNAAAKAGTSVDCNGQPLRVRPETGTFQEQGRRSAFTNGEAAWVFQAQCG